MRVFLEELCQELRGIINEDSPAFTPNGPFKKASGKTIGHWLTISLLPSDTLILREVKVNKVGTRLIFSFTSPTSPGCEAIEMPLEVAEAHLNDFKEYIMMALDTNAYLSEIILETKANKLREDKTHKAAVAAEEVERHSKNLLWGSW